MENFWRHFWKLWVLNYYWLRFFKVGSKSTILQQYCLVNFRLKTLSQILCISILSYRFPLCIDIGCFPPHEKIESWKFSNIDNFFYYQENLFDLKKVNFGFYSAFTSVSIKAMILQINNLLFIWRFRASL